MTSCILIAALVSSASRMFFSGGEWLPDEVPNRAIYDTAQPDGKELRVTTNVQAAVTSCYSGLIERALYTGAWDDDQYGWMRDEESRRTSNFRTFGWTGLDELCNAERRRIESTRIYDDLSNLRDELRLVAAQRYWGQSRWGSTRWPVDDSIPTWEWTGDDMLRAFGVGAFANAWIGFCSCTNDGVWKIASEIHRDQVYDVLNSFVWPGSPDFRFDEDMIEQVRTNANTVSVTCFEILDNRIGTNAVRFADDSRRLIYHKLGAFETAIGAMDRTFDGSMNKRPFNYLDLNYTHTVSTSTPFEEVDAIVDFDNGRLDYSARGTPEWRDSDVVTVTTNESFCGQRDDPIFLCTGDTPKPFLNMSVSSSIVITKEMLDSLVGGYDFRFGDRYFAASLSGDTLRLEWLTGDEPPSYLGEPMITAKIPQGEFKRQMTAGITRRTRVGFTTGGLVSNQVDLVYQPSELAWRERMPKVDLYSAEMRLVATNYCPNLDRLLYDGGYWYDDVTNRGISVSTRFSQVGRSYATTNALVSAMNLARLRHRTAVEDPLATFLGCGLGDPASLLPVPAGIVTGMRADLERINHGSITTGLDIMEIGVTGKTNDGAYNICYWHGPSYEIKNAVVSASSPLVIGSISMSQEPYKEIDLEGRPPCGSEGTFTPFYDIKWKFKNLYEE